MTPQRQMHPNNPCPCQSGKTYASCCGPILQNSSLADSPESLMRSRYTAYVLHDRQHLLRTWHPTSRPERLSFDEVRWVRLTIHESSSVMESSLSGTVVYSAQHIASGSLVTLTEKSRFIKNDGGWLYHDGDVDITEHRLSGKTQCPCGSGKKFKRCCRTLSPSSNGTIF